MKWNPYLTPRIKTSVLGGLKTSMQKPCSMEGFTKDLCVFRHKLLRKRSMHLIKYKTLVYQKIK